MTDIADVAPTVAQARTLLAEAGLPIDDLDNVSGLRLFGIRRGGRWTGVVGLQPLEEAALLRSLAVASFERGQGDGAALVAAAEAFAVRSGWCELYLLTTGAAAYFGRLGYQSISREQAPPMLRATRQFAELCPATAQIMRKRLVSPDRG